MLAIRAFYNNTRLALCIYFVLTMLLVMYGCKQSDQQMTAFPNILDFGSAERQKSFIIIFKNENKANSWFLCNEDVPSWLSISPVSGSNDTEVMVILKREFLNTMTGSANIVISDGEYNKYTIKVFAKNTDVSTGENCIRTDLQGTWYIFFESGDFYEESGFMIFDNGVFGLYGNGIYFNEENEVISKYSLGNLGTYSISPNSGYPHEIDIEINKIREEEDSNVYTEEIVVPISLKGIYAFENGNLVMSANGVGLRPRTFNSRSQVWVRMINELEIDNYDYWNGEDLYDFSLD